MADETPEGYLPSAAPKMKWHEKTEVDTDLPPTTARHAELFARLKRDLNELGADVKEVNQVVSKLYDYEHRHRESMGNYHPYNARLGLQQVRADNRRIKEYKKEVRDDPDFEHQDAEYADRAIVRSKEQVVYVPEHSQKPHVSEQEQEPYRRSIIRWMQKNELGEPGRRYRQRKEQRKLSRFHRKKPYDL
jgi:hypothetical protein